MIPRRLLVPGVVLMAAAAALVWCAALQRGPWTESEKAQLRSLSLIALGPVPADPGNRYADDPGAARLGQAFFFDPRFSANGAVSCASCHVPRRQFTDGMALAQGIGTTDRTTMPLAGAQYMTWLFWDGRNDSLWAQALGPLESAVEHGGSRGLYAHLIAAHYREQYEAVFGPLPDLSDERRFPRRAGPVEDDVARAAWQRMRPEDRDAVTRIFVNMGKAIAAYERLLLPGQARFDRYVAAVLAGDERTAAATLTADEIAGLRLFIGRAECSTCHSGPLLTNGSFHNTGVPARPGRSPDPGRGVGAPGAAADEFNCLSKWSDATSDECVHLRFLDTDGPQLHGQFKVPTLRGAAERDFLMHAGQFSTLDEVLEHYRKAPRAPVGRTELHPLALSEGEVRQLLAFLRTVDLPAPSAELLAPPGHR